MAYLLVNLFQLVKMVFHPPDLHQWILPHQALGRWAYLPPARRLRILVCQALVLCHRTIRRSLGAKFKILICPVPVALCRAVICLSQLDLIQESLYRPPAARLPSYRIRLPSLRRPGVLYRRTSPSPVAAPPVPPPHLQASRPGPSAPSERSLYRLALDQSQAQLRHRKAAIPPIPTKVMMGQYLAAGLMGGPIRSDFRKYGAAYVLGGSL